MAEQQQKTQPASSTKSVSKSKGTPVISTLRYLPVAEIHDDVIVLKDGSARAVLEVENINFGLKSEEEQTSIVYAYQHFLNSLEFPIQILLTSKKLDIEGYLDSLKARIREQDSPLIQAQTLDYVNFVMRFIEFADIMEKKSYIIVPVDKMGTSSVNKSIFQQFWESLHPEDDLYKFKLRMKNFESMKKSLQQRVNIVKAGIENTSLASRQLSTKELIALFYQTYNPVLAFEQKIKELNLGSIKAKS